MIQEFDAQGRLIREWDYRSTPRRYREWDAAGVLIVDRGFNALEDQMADIEIAKQDGATATAQLRKQLYDGVTALEQARADAQGDVATANGLNATALNLKTAATTQKGQVQAFIPKTTYTQSDLTAIRDAIATVIARQETIIQAMADMYVYRVAVDNNAVLTDNSIIWLARLTSDRVLG